MLVLLWTLRCCILIRDALLLPIENLNNWPVFPLFVATPLPYAIGTCAEDIRHVINAANTLNKKPVLICLPSLCGLLRFRTAAKALFTIKIVNDGTLARYAFVSEITVQPLYIYIALIFILSRISYILLKYTCKALINDDVYRYKKVHILLDRLSFPRLGCKLACSVLYKMLLSDESHIERLLDNTIEQKLEFSSAYLSAWKSYLKAEQINLSGRFIVIHTRSTIYHSDDGRRPYRNASISTYTKMIGSLTESGFKVVLIGGSVMEKLDIKNDNLYDLRFGKRGKPCSLDVFLVAGCYRYIGMQSGPLDLAILFGRKSFVLNSYTPHYCFGFKAETIYLLQYHKALESNGISEIVKEGICIIGVEEMSPDGYELRRLSADDLLRFCEDFILTSQYLNTYKHSYWRDVTYLKNKSPCGSTDDNGYNSGFYSTYQGQRWLVNTMISRSSVKIYEVQ